MLWLAKDYRGIMLFSGVRPEKNPDGEYISKQGPVGRIPDSDINFKMGSDSPVPVKIVKDNGD